MELSEARSYAMSLGEVTEQPHHELSSFRVRGKIFATVPRSGTHLHLFPSEEVREQALAMYPEFAEKLLWGGKVAGIRVTLTAARSAAVKSLLRAAWQYKAKAPKSLLGTVVRAAPTGRPARVTAPLARELGEAGVEPSPSRSTGPLAGGAGAPSARGR